MQLYEILDLVASCLDKADMLWNFFIWIHLAVIAGLMLLHRRLYFLERLFAVLAYLGFLFMNYSAMVDTYDYLDVLIAEASRFNIDPGTPGSLVANYWQTFDLPDHIGYLPLVYGAAAVAFSIGLLGANFFYILSLQHERTHR